MPSNIIRDATVNLGVRETNIELIERLTQGMLEGKKYVQKGTKDPVDYEKYLNTFIAMNENISLLGKAINDGETIADSIAQRYVVLTDRSNQIAPQVREVAIRSGLIQETVEETAPEQPVATISRLGIALASTAVVGLIRLVASGYFYRDAIGSYLPDLALGYDSFSLDVSNLPIKDFMSKALNNAMSYVGSYLPSSNVSNNTSLVKPLAIAGGLSIPALVKPLAIGGLSILGYPNLFAQFVNHSFGFSPAGFAPLKSNDIPAKPGFLDPLDVCLAVCLPAYPGVCPSNSSAVCTGF